MDKQTDIYKDKDMTTEREKIAKQIRSMVYPVDDENNSLCDYLCIADWHLAAIESAKREATIDTAKYICYSGFVNDKCNKIDDCCFMCERCQQIISENTQGVK